MYRMMFLKVVHVTEAGPDRIFPKERKKNLSFLEDNSETYNRDRVIHTDRETEI